VKPRKEVIFEMDADLDAALNPAMMDEPSESESLDAQENPSLN
jgi:hypothetical protein